MSSYFDRDNYLDEYFGDFSGGWYDLEEDAEIVERRERQPNCFGYSFGDYMASNYYPKFLCPSARDKTYATSTDRRSDFRSRFRVPLTLIDELTSMFIDRGWVHSSYNTTMQRSYKILRQNSTLHNVCFGASGQS